MKWPEIDFFIDQIKKWEFSGKNILDIWCGNGRLIDSLLKNNIITGPWHYLWIDLSEWLIWEAQKLHPSFNFIVSDMLDVDKINEKFDMVFMIASFHHLDTTEKRLEFLKKISTILNDWWRIYMTNWNLYSQLNKEKYWKSIIPNSKNSFWNFDFKIKFWEYLRYYHGFDTTELEDLFESTCFKMSENRVFENEKNIISIIKK